MNRDALACQVRVVVVGRDLRCLAAHGIQAADLRVDALPRPQLRVELLDRQRHHAIASPDSGIVPAAGERRPGERSDVQRKPLRRRRRQARAERDPVLHLIGRRAWLFST